MMIRVQEPTTETSAMHSLLQSAMTANRNMLAGTFAMMTRGQSGEAENEKIVICYPATMIMGSSMMTLNLSMMI